MVVNNDEEDWYCLDKNNIINRHAMKPAKIRAGYVNRWIYHSEKNCSKLEYFLKHLFCLESDEKMIYIWFNQTWTSLQHSQKAVDFALLYDGVHIGFIGMDEKIYKFSLSGLLDY